MAPIEFEKQIKERLEERKIQPSGDAWGNVKNRIDIPAKEKKSGIFRYAVAATIVGILFSFFWMVNQSGDQSMENQPIVDNPVEREEESKRTEGAEPNPVVPAIQITETSVSEKENDFEEQQNEEILNEDHELALEIQQAIPQGEPMDFDTEQRIDQKIAEVVAQVKFLEDNKESVTEAEVDSLLKNAQEELVAESSVQNDQGINATALLAGVEDELNKTFRDQVFERLKNGFVKVRTAVADRNK